MARSIRSTLALLAAAAISLSAPQPAWADSTKQPAITAVRADAALVSIEIAGLNLGTKAPRVTIGNVANALTITSATPTLVTALLPPGMTPGGYLLTYSAAKDKTGTDNDQGSNYDEFWVTLGAAGPQGLQGPKGDTGSSGPVGLTGPAGAKGDAGPQGLAGKDGLTGPAGLQGIAGVAGSPGSQGPMGLQGPQGPAGAQGPMGATGLAGPAGARGDPGAQGPAGLAGVAGPAGTNGASGPQGPMGLTGPAGPAGPAGPQGAAGTASSTASLANLDALNNADCNVGSACPGKVSIGYNAVTFGVSMSCVPETATLNVSLAGPPQYYESRTCYSTSPLCLVNCSWECGSWKSNTARVYSEPAGIDFTVYSLQSNSQSHQFCKGTAVSLHLVWYGPSTATGDCTDVANCSLVMTGAKAVTINPN